jgi:UDP-N-acetylmuramoylalanine--D-glutamate ligase
MVSTLEEAVSLARRLTAPGGVVLFSPACSSFDMFKNYEERGDLFVSLVQGLPEAAA